jgi:hypothetical protein
MNTDIEEIAINLQLLARVDKNQKLVTRGSYLNIESRSLIPEFIRRWNRQDNRDETLKKINKVVDAAIKHIHANSDDVYNIKLYLKNAMVGVSNLKETYSICSQTCARLDFTLDKMNKALEGYDPETLSE